MNTILKLLDLPRLGLVAIFLTLLMLSAVVDPDYFWHLKTGQYLVEHGALPAGDIFSYTQAGKPWVLHEWLFEVLLYGVFSVLGEPGTKLLVAMLATASLAVTYATANRILRKPYLAFALAVICFIFVAPGISPRPQLVTFLLLATYLWILTGFKYFRETRGLLALPLLMAVWVNFHGGYAVGLALLFLFTASEWLVFFAAEKRSTEQQRRLQWLSLATAGSLLASLANPYFLGHLLYPFQVMAMEASRSYISEWQSPDFHDPQYQGYLALVCIFFIATIYRNRKADLTELALPMSFLMLGFVAVRHTPLAAVAAAPFLAVALAGQPLAQMLPARWLRGFVAWHGRRVQGGNDLGDKEFLLNWLLLLFMFVGFLLAYPAQSARNAEKVQANVPTGATDFLVREHIEGRMFNTYHYGGYLIYRLYPAQKVFIDGRADMYGDAFLAEYGAISDGAENWRTLFDKYRIDYVIVQRSQPLRQLLLERGDFNLVYQDKADSVLLRNSQRYAAIIARHGQ